MRKSSSNFYAAALLSLAPAMLSGTAARAADLPETQRQVRGPVVAACGAREIVILFDERGYPTIPARTPYFYCVTGTVLLPGDIPPPPEYCCH
jgi:hypothetical protein